MRGKKANSTIHMIVPPWPVDIKNLPIPFVPEEKGVYGYLCLMIYVYPPMITP